MKVTKWALLAGAAIAVTATAARADDLSALKAQIDALQSRVSELEAQPQSSMPSGYSLMAIRDGQGTYEGVLPERPSDRVREDQGFTLSVVPTADAAPVAEVSVSGEIRTALIYTDDDFDLSGTALAGPPGNADDPFDSDEDSLDVAVRGRIFIKGKIDTAVGEVGGYFRLEATGGRDFTDYSESTNMNKAYGWWKFAPEWELMAGYNDNTAALQGGWDWDAATSPLASGGPTNPNNEQMRLTYASGPLSFAIALEDPDFDTAIEHPVSDADNDLPSVQAYLMYSSDALMLQAVGLYQTANDTADDWALGGAASFGITDGFKISAAAVFGEGTSTYANNAGPITADEEFWAGSVGLILGIAEDSRLELGVGYEDYDNSDALAFGGGFYWDPVSQVTVGVGATYVERNLDVTSLAIPVPNTNLVLTVPCDCEADDDTLEVFFGTWLRFP